jgi:hypothetical protein
MLWDCKRCEILNLLFLLERVKSHGGVQIDEFMQNCIVCNKKKKKPNLDKMSYKVHSNFYFIAGLLPDLAEFL